MFVRDLILTNTYAFEEDEESKNCVALEKQMLYKHYERSKSRRIFKSRAFRLFA